MDIIKQQIAEIAKQYPKVTKVVLFGSRARDQHRERSDIDLAIYADGDAYDFCEELETRVRTLLEFDITIITKSTDQALVTQIEKDGINIYEQF